MASLLLLSSFHSLEKQGAKKLNNSSRTIHLVSGRVWNGIQGWLNNSHLFAYSWATSSLTQASCLEMPGEWSTIPASRERRAGGGLTWSDSCPAVRGYWRGGVCHKSLWGRRRVDTGKGTSQPSVTASERGTVKRADVWLFSVLG